MGLIFEDGRFDIGKKIDYLRATVELAARARRPRTGVPGQILAEICRRDGIC